MSLESGKTLGGIGALLMVIGSFVPFLSIIGIILLLIGLKRLAEYYNDNNIFQNALYGVIFGIIGIVAAAFIVLISFFGFAIFEMGTGFTTAGPFAFVGSILVALIVAFIFYLLAAIFYKKSFDILSEKTEEKMFSTAGILLLIGAILTIVLIGLILMFVAWILATIAFFSIKTVAVQPSAPPPPPPES